MENQFEKIVELMYRCYYKGKGCDEFMCDISLIKNNEKQKDVYTMWCKITLNFLGEFTQLMEDAKKLDDIGFEAEKEHFIADIVKKTTIEE